MPHNTATVSQSPFIPTHEREEESMPTTEIPYSVRSDGALGHRLRKNETDLHRRRD